jgi:hypothetical protein
VSGDILNTPASPETTKPILEALTDSVGSDRAGKSVEHAFRIPGTLNFPTLKKVRAGRSPEPFMTRVVHTAEDFEEGLANVSLGELREAIVSKYPNAFDAQKEKSADVAFDWEQRLRPLSEWRDTEIHHRLNDSPHNDRSRGIWAVINEGLKHGATPNEVAEKLLNHRDTICMEHYGEGEIENRVRAGVRRAFEKYEAPASLAEVITLLPKLEWRDFPDRTEGGKPHQTAANARHVLSALPIEFKYNQFREQPEIGDHKLQMFHGDVSDSACLMLRMFCKRVDVFNFEPNTRNMEDAIWQLCLKNTYDPVRDYLDGLEWDGRKRLNTRMIDYLGAEDTELTREIGRLTLIAGVRRVRKPGCKFDQIIVLEGPEGKNKSTAILTLAQAVGDEYFSDQRLLDIDEKTQQELLHGKWLYECADLTGLKRADVDKVKAFASRTCERGRRAYGHFVTEQPRRCVIFATTNDEEYLQSRTDNRRFWPIKTGKIDIAKLTADRDQLWAEAAYEEARDASIILAEKFWPVAAAEQAKRLERDPWEYELMDVKGSVVPGTTLKIEWEERVSSAELSRSRLGFTADKMLPVHAKRLRYICSALGGSTKIKFGGGKASVTAPAMCDRLRL